MMLGAALGAAVVSIADNYTKRGNGKGRSGGSNNTWNPKMKLTDTHIYVFPLWLPLIWKILIVAFGEHLQAAIGHVILSKDKSISCGRPTEHDREVGGSCLTEQLISMNLCNVLRDFLGI
jgi:hypothetical protein